LESEILNLKCVETWYKEKAKPFLLKMQPERVAEFDKDLESLLAKAKKIPRDFSACVLGNSGVGKSTLINSIVDGNTTVLPSGGVGPLTAQALTVKHSLEPKFEVEYHTPRKFWQLLFGFEMSFHTELNSKNPDFTTLNPETGELEQKEATTSAQSSEEAAAESRTERRKTIQLMISGNQDQESDIHYLVDSMRQVTGRQRIMGTQARPEDLPRIKRIREALDFAKQKISKTFDITGTSKGEFLQELRYHASGFLAPLIKNLSVYWPSDVLSNGVTLVDLPGVGISGDVYREVTRKWIREKSQAIVLVVDHRGITEAVAQLLRSSEFLTRLIYTADDPIDDPVLVVAVTKLDDIAESARNDEKQRLAPGQKPRPLRDHFQNACSEAITKIRGQVRQQLENMVSSDPEVSATQKQVIDNILNTLQVFPVSAPQYRKFIANDEDDKPFINSAEQSNIPLMQDSLKNLSSNRKNDALKKLDQNRRLFLERTSSQVRIIMEKWIEETRATEVAEELRNKLTLFMSPLREALKIRQGEFRGFLKDSIPTRIEDLVVAALAKAQNEISGYLWGIGSAHWTTLRASVKREGVFKGARDIDLPREFAFRIEEPIADAWSKKILKEIRKKTNEYGEVCVSIVGQIVDWAKEQGSRVKVNLVQAQFDSIKADVALLNSVGKELINDLRDQVKNQLIETIEPPIRLGCRKFVEKNDHIGTGVKRRILELFSLLAKEVTEIVEDDAKNILTNLYQGVRSEVIAAFEKHQDPLQDAANAIVATQEEYLKRSDRQRKKVVLEEATGVLSALPAFSA
jgi:GTP-binding protein EngB required for normal cell division